MPELPEVETVVRVIRPLVVGRTIERARFTIPRQLAPQTPAQLARAVKGRTIASVKRRGKYILLDLETGTLLIHLRMTGRLYVRERDQAGDYERAWFDLDDGRVLVFRDGRTLGTLRWFANGSAIGKVAELGWEPLEEKASGEMLREALQPRKMAIKPVLLDQTVYAGIGNIYASEALWVAEIDPRKAAQQLTRAECERLAEAVPSVLRRALKQGGSTLRDFASPDGTPGSYQREFRVYGRAGEACSRCGTEIERIVQAQRSTYFCPTCQGRRARPRKPK